MKDIKMLREEREKLVAEAQSYPELAKIEERELDADEMKRIDEILGSGDKPGLIDEYNEKIARAEKINAISQQKLATRAADERWFVGDETEEPANRKIILPAQAKRKVRHFESPEDAYTVGQFVLASMFGSKKSREWCDSHGVGIQAAHSTLNNEKGGYLVPDVMEESIIRLVEERGVFRRRGFVYPMGSATATVPRRSAGFTVYYPGEGGEISLSDLTLNQIKLSAKKAGILTALSSEVDEDAVSTLASLITEEIAYAFADAEDREGFNGDGTSTFGGTVGLKNALQAGSVATAATGNVSPSTLDLADWRKALGKLPRFPGMVPVWFMHSTVYHEGAALLMDAAGGNTSSDIANGTAEQFLGYPVQFVQTMDDASAAAGSILAYVGDLRMTSTMGTRRGVTIASDTSVYFTSDQIAVRATQRYDINIHERGTATAAGPMIALKSASS